MEKKINVRERKDGRFEARYIRTRDENGKIKYGYCYGKSYEEAINKRDEMIALLQKPKRMNLLILGAGAHGLEVREIADSFRMFEKIAFLDDNKKDDTVIGKCEDISKYVQDYPIAIPAVGNSSLRKKWMNELLKNSFIIPVLIHSSANVSNTALIKTGSVICAGATIGAGAVVGKGCIVDSGAIVEKGAIVEDWTLVECGEIVKKN